MLALPDGAVDVADADGDQEDRHWDAPVLCTFRLLPPGDVAMELDITVEDATAGTLTEELLALGLAARGEKLRPPPLGTAERLLGRRAGRALRQVPSEAVDTDEDTAYRVDAVEEEVPALPRARVETLPEILDREPVPTRLRRLPRDTPHRHGGER
ncbi:hypothetical protein [Streptomyces chartreusis]|uniref:hypothetical protein n=1 Tax=Streptomyces chartreusis TaxID=1969 RepID=UPI0033B57315